MVSSLAVSLVALLNKQEVGLKRDTAADKHNGLKHTCGCRQARERRERERGGEERERERERERECLTVC